MKTAKQRIVVMKNHGLTVPYVAKCFGCSVDTVRSYLKKGVVPRGKSGPPNPSLQLLGWIVSQIQQRATEDEPEYKTLTIEQFMGLAPLSGAAPSPRRSPESGQSGASPSTRVGGVITGEHPGHTPAA